MRNIGLTFTHENVDFEGCDAQFGADCTIYGVPVLENDVMDFQLSMDLEVRVTSMYLTYGVTDRFDFGSWCPVVQADFRGESDAEIRPVWRHHRGALFLRDHDQSCSQRASAEHGVASGLGDVAMRAKLNIRETPGASLPFWSMDGFRPAAVRISSARANSRAGRWRSSIHGLAIFRRT